MSRVTRRATLAGLATMSAASAFSFGASPVRAQALKPLNYGFTSSNASDWAAYVAQKLGFYEAQGLAVDFAITGSAAANAQQLTAGSIDLGGISSTQVIEAIEGGAPLSVVLNRTHTTPYLVVGKKGLHTVKDLKGKTIIVGGPNDVTLVLMNGILAGNGLKQDDVTYTFAGGTPERFAALLSGTVDAAILIPPFSFRAVDQGFAVLAEAIKYFPTFPLDLVATNVHWARAHKDTLEAYLRAYLLGMHWLYQPANRERAIALLSEATKTPNEDAVKTYDAYIKAKVLSQTGLTPLAGMDVVIGTLAKIGMLKPPLPSPAKYVDNQYAEQAAASLRGKI